MFFGSQILILYAVGWHIRQNISLAVSTQFCHTAYVATKLMFRLICNCRASESRSKLYLVMPSAADNQ